MPPILRPVARFTTYRGEVTITETTTTTPREHAGAKLERLRILKEHELGAWVEEVEGDLYVRTTER
jgi:hypothetical protein